MKRLIARRPSPATAIACVALFVALGGVSYGFATGSIDSREIKNESIQTEDLKKGGVRPSDIRNDSIRTEDLRNNEIRGVDIRNSTIRGVEVGLNSLGGADIAEDTLGPVPTAISADTLDGVDSAAFARGSDLGRFSLKLEAGQTVAVASHGQVAVLAECEDSAQDEVRLYASTTSEEALLDGVDNYLTEATPLTPTTAPEDAELASSTEIGTSAAQVAESNGGGFVLGTDGRALHLQGGSTALGFNVAGGDCIVAGELSKTG